MAGSSAERIPDFTSLDEFQEFWDTHDTTEFEDQLREVEFTVDVRRRRHLRAEEEEDTVRRIRTSPR